MPDFYQHGTVTTLHDLRSLARPELEEVLVEATQDYPIGLVLPITADDMRAAPFDRIIEQLTGVEFLKRICVVLNRAPAVDDYLECVSKLDPLGDLAVTLWADGPRISAMYDELIGAGFRVATPGKGRAVWTAFGYLLADLDIHAFVLHDCDIVDYDRMIVARLCLPMAHPSLDFEFCKAYYARVTDRMHGRVARLLMRPLVQAMLSIVGPDPFLVYLDCFRYPLSGEFAVTANLARSNRIPSDWGLEIGTLAEVFRNTSNKRVCQVDLCRLYEHKHQGMSLEDPAQGLMKMAGDILTTIFRTLASRGTVLHSGHFLTLRAAYLRLAQDSIRQYHADALINGLHFSRHDEEEAVEGFAERILAAGEVFQNDPLGGEAIPNWARVLAAFPDFPERLAQATVDDAAEYG